MMNVIHNQLSERENKSLAENAGVVYDEFTTKSINGNRSRYLSGIFLPKIPFTNGSGLLRFIRLSIELAVRATRRNKTGNRANNADCLMAVVEPLPHLLQVQAVSFIHKLTRTIKMTPYTLKAIARTDLNNTRKQIAELPIYTLRIKAESEQHARRIVAPFYFVMGGLGNA